MKRLFLWRQKVGLIRILRNADHSVLIFDAMLPRTIFDSKRVKKDIEDAINRRVGISVITGLNHDESSASRLKALNINVYVRKIPNNWSFFTADGKMFCLVKESPKFRITINMHAKRTSSFLQDVFSKACSFESTDRA